MIVIRGESVEVPGLRTVSYVQDSDLRLGRRWNYRPRRADESVEFIVVHSTLGWPTSKHPAPQSVREDEVAPGALHARAVVADWRRGGRFAGSHLVLDFDGSVLCCADLALDAAYHARTANGRSVGIEVVQGRDAAFYRAQIDALPVLVAAVSDAFGIPRRVAFPYRGARSSPGAEPGVWGHRDLTEDRGAGDPGDALMRGLVDAGWEPF